MKRSEVADIMEESYEHLLSMFQVKNGEYASDSDALQNFKMIASELKLAPEAVLWVYLRKHLLSLTNAIDDIDKGAARTLAEPTAGRIDDAIVYLQLLRCLLMEREAMQISE
jgi:hypothetical protein